MKLHPHLIAYLHSDRKTGWVALQADEPLQSGKCIGFVVKVIDIKITTMKWWWNAQLSSFIELFVSVTYFNEEWWVKVILAEEKKKHNSFLLLSYSYALQYKP